MLTALAYHNVGEGKHTNSLQMLTEHFRWIAGRYQVVLPGDPLGKKPILLTFDDAYYGFYHYVFPLLKRFHLKALLGVPVRYILDTTTLSSEERLSVPYTMAMQDGFFDQKAPFCTFEELKEMVLSGHVEVASHSFAHCNLTFSFVDLHREVIESKEVLEAKLPQAISSFIYPFGRVNERVHQFVMDHYAYAFRLGSMTNRSWDASKKPLGRICGDRMRSPTSLFSPFKRARYYLKGLA